ncbi:hypothetical protein BDZ94DRAFT_1247605 [Collybia nuda]|uniref:Uncharacterized protein n=1 Tax=Collybia nuda TaxID=64659 RepID=A0A9P6CP90_9AGAR|nr:hypothetical protein BDZ94DRAFT_1247605 [Collybia nuda]
MPFKGIKLDTPKRMVGGFAVSLGIAGFALYYARQVMTNKRKIELDAYRASQAEARDQDHPLGVSKP